MLIDCDTCAVRDLQCGDCVMTVLLAQRGPATVELDPAEQSALAALADGGLVPPLRLVPLRPDVPRDPATVLRNTHKPDKPAHRSVAG